MAVGGFHVSRAVGPRAPLLQLAVGWRPPSVSLPWTSQRGVVCLSHVVPCAVKARTGELASKMEPALAGLGLGWGDTHYFAGLMR